VQELASYAFSNEDNAAYLRKHDAFVLKIQAIDSGTPLPAYTKKKELKFHIVPSEAGYKELFDRIVKDGVDSQRGYFNAYVKNFEITGKVVIVTQPLLPPQPW
jgi:hypothetical protein